MALSQYAINLLNGVNYADLLPSREFPTVQNFPGLASIMTDLISWLEQASTVLEQAAQTSQFPSTLSYGSISSLAAQGVTYAQQLDNMSPAPAVFCAEVWDVVSSLQTLLLYPELLSV